MVKTILTHFENFLANKHKLAIYKNEKNKCEHSTSKATVCPEQSMELTAVFSVFSGMEEMLHIDVTIQQEARLTQQLTFKKPTSCSLTAVIKKEVT